MQQILNKFTIMKYFIFCIYLLGSLYSLPAIASSKADLKLLQAKNKEMKQLNMGLDKLNISYHTAKIELDTARSTLSSLKNRVEVERERLDQLIEGESKYPDIDFTDKINSQRKSWRQANKKYLSDKEYVRILKNKSNQDAKKYQTLKKRKAILQASIDRVADRYANDSVNRELRKIQKPQNITASAVETCSLSVTKDTCMDKARIKAEREAAERGSVVVVESVTEVKNFNLTRDEARSRVNARISDIRIVKQSFDLTPDKTGWHVEYEITALVTPAITDQMRADLKRQIIARVNSGAYFADGARSDQIRPVKQSSYKQSDTLQIIDKNKRPGKKQVEQEVERELEEIKTRAKVKARKREAKEAKDEIDSREIMIMTF